MQIFFLEEEICVFFEFDCSDRTFEEIQIFAGFQDSNLDMLSKCFKSVCMIRDQKIKVEVNETLSAHKVEEVIEACFQLLIRSIV